MVPRAVIGGRRDPALAQRQVRPRAPAGAAGARVSTRLATYAGLRATHVGGIALERLATRVGSTPFFAYDRGADHRARRLLRATLPADDQAQLRDQGQPDARRGAAHGRPRRRASTSPRPASSRIALDTPMPRRSRELRGPGQDARASYARGRGRRAHRARVRDRGRAAHRDRRAARHPAARGDPGQPRLRAQGLGHEDGRRRAAVRRRRRARAGAARRARRVADVDWLGFHVFAGSQNLNAEILCRGAAQDRRAGAAARRRRARPRALPEHRRRLRHSLLRARRAARPRRDRREPRGPHGRRDPAAAARGAHRRRAGPLPRRRGGRLRHARRRPQGVARHDLPRRRRRAAPPARRVRQLRPGHPPQLPGRGRQRGTPSEPTRDRSPSSAASARRSTCSRDDASCRAAEIGDLVVVFQAGAYGLTASPTAFLGHPAPAEVLV